MRVGFVAGEHADSMSKADGLDIANHSPTHVSASLPLSAVADKESSLNSQQMALWYLEHGVFAAAVAPEDHIVNLWRLLPTAVGGGVPATEHKQQTLAQQHRNLMQADHQPSHMVQAPHTPGPDGLAQMIVAITPGRPPLMPTPYREPQTAKNALSSEQGSDSINLALAEEDAVPYSRCHALCAPAALPSSSHNTRLDIHSSLSSIIYIPMPPEPDPENVASLSLPLSHSRPQCVPRQSQPAAETPTRPAASHHATLEPSHHSKPTALAIKNIRPSQSHCYTISTTCSLARGNETNQKRPRR
ncbi:hypothetical protein ACCO45_012087 [Purpureocillium lilacinum]|uniref:Uncharacterized protein n=1 Tax=Purpureocillium lilacinum TaxID=33203 RepID=A0ACC4DFA8_PURLI